MYMVSTLNKENTTGLNPSYHHGNLREALISQGLILLESSQGAEFSMRELTRMIGVSANSVYRHFSNKEELLTALAIYGFEQLLSAQAYSIQSTPDSKDGFILSGQEYINFARKNPALFRLMYGRFAVTREDDSLKALANLAYTGMLYALANILQTSIEDSKAKNLAIKAWSVVHGLSHLLIDGQFDNLSKNECDEMIHQILNTYVLIDIVYSIKYQLIND